MSQTEVNFNIEIEGTFVVPTEELRPRVEVQKDLVDQVRKEWEPVNPEEGEEVSVSAEVEYVEK